MGSEHYCLRWNNHQSNLLGVFSQLLRDESLVDVTLACSEGHSIRAHKVVLSACSSYFQTLFVDHPSRHPIVILKDVRFSELRTLIEFMYKGEVNVEYCQLSALLKTAESLKVKGLAEMTREYKQIPEQTEPKELTTRRSLSHNQSRPLTPNDVEDSQHSASPVQNLRICKSPTEKDRERDRDRDMRERERDRDRDRERDRDKDRERDIENEEKLSPMGETVPQPVSNDFGPNDMSIHNSNNLIATCSSVPNTFCNRLSPSVNCDPIPGPSNLPPVQQVPLSLKKEVDWGGGGGEDKKPPIESPSDFSRNQQDSEQDTLDGSPRMYPCMYCGNSFPHQSKLTRHILSHSLETLKYREQRHHMSPLTIPEPTLAYMDFSGRLSSNTHEPPDPTDQPPTPMDLDIKEAAAAALGTTSSGVVLCKFCGKSFPDVSSLITHLPVHTGDRPFKCEFCGKAFKLRHHMKDHCRVHTGERPFRCTLCGKTFSRSTILKAHEKTHYPKYVRKFLSPNQLDTEEENPH